MTRNVLEVRKSLLHGAGVFAAKRIRAGEKVGRWVGKRTARNGRHVCWLKFSGEWRGYRGGGRLRFLNHADQPNSKFRGLDLYALQNVRRGDEVTIDYGDGYEWDDGHKKIFTL